MLLASDPDALYAALLARDPAYDGHWFVGVSTTGIFCRLTCPARKPKREHCSFYRRPESARQAGFRPCLRCRPADDVPAANPALRALRGRVAAEPGRRWSEADLVMLGLDPSTVRRGFKRLYGITFAQFARAQRLGAGIASLTAGTSVIEAQLDAGYASASGFREAVGRLLGQAPAKVREPLALKAAWIDTPIGAMLGVASEAGICLLEFADRIALPRALERLQARHGPVVFGDSPMLTQLHGEVERYFAGGSGGVEVPLVQPANPFTSAVWAGLRRIPFGETRSYAALADALGRPGAAGAVARANAANQIAILLPCHRLLGSGGELTGYGGKLWRKRWLLEHEQRHSQGRRSS